MNTISFQYEVLIRNILAAFWYNRSDSEVKEICEELKNRFSKHNCKHTTDGDDLYSTFIMFFGDYGTSPRSGWLEKITPEFMINTITDFEDMYLGGVNNGNINS